MKTAHLYFLTNASQKGYTERRKDMIEITSVEVNIKERMITIEGTDMDSLWVEHIDESDDIPTVRYYFNMNITRHNNYFMAVLKNNKACQKKLSIPDKARALIGQYVNLPESFTVRQYEEEG